MRLAVVAALAGASLVAATAPQVGVMAAAVAPDRPSAHLREVVTATPQRDRAAFGHGYRGRLESVEAASASDVWTGSYSRNHHHWMQHFDGTGWSSGSAPIESDMPVVGISAVSENDVWLCGHSGMEHWDGTRWTRVPSLSPGPTGEYAYVEGIEAISTDDVWTVGFYDPYPETAQTLTEHWDGTSWSRVPSPSPNKTRYNLGNTLESVSAVSATDVWAVGWFDKQPEGVKNALILHWDGTRWTKVHSPSPGSSVGRGVTLTSVSAVSSRDVWAVGESIDSGGSRPRPVILHWDGTQWSRVPASARPAGQAMTLTAISASSATDAWVVGLAYEDSSGVRTVALHWDGTRWARVPSISPHPGKPLSTTYAAFTAVDSVSSRNAWAVGHFYAGPHDLGRTLIEHWDGESWTRS